jgi:hypothetical protein
LPAIFTLLKRIKSIFSALARPPPRFQIPKIDGFGGNLLVTELFLSNRENNRPKKNQIQLKKNYATFKLTTSAGVPVADNQNSMTAGPRGPLLIQDYQLLEKLAHQNCERIPERPVHVKGWGAHGNLTVTHDITKYTRAKIFSEVGKKLK